MNRAAVAAVVEEGLGALLADCRDFVEAAGIASLWQSLGRFDRETFVAVCAERLGFRVQAGNRERMLAVLLDLATEAGWMRRTGTMNIAQPPPPARGRRLPRVPPGAEGELRFFRTCLERAPAYLRGEVPGIDFNPPQEALWDAFLACPLHEFGRRWVLAQTGLEDAPELECLDLAYGTGRSTAALCRRFPLAGKTAIDQRGKYQAAAARRCAEVLSRCTAARPVRWLSADPWADGFDAALPFPDRSFDLVFFSCGAPYLRPQRMDGFYTEVHRVLRPGGRLALLAWTYPEAGYPVHRASRLRALLHDLSESVCAGWQGFPAATAVRDCLERVDFVPPPDWAGSYFGLDGAAVLGVRAGAG